jgi:transcriptional regulator with XRE-family HTH domain
MAQGPLDILFRDYPIAALARASGLHPSHVGNLRSGRISASAATLARLKFAAQRIKAEMRDGSYDPAWIYRLLLVASALALELEPEAVVRSRPAAKAVADPRWKDASLARRLAFYMMNTGAGYQQVEVAKAAGVTKAAVSLAVREIEEARDGGAIGGAVARLEGWMGVVS